MQVLMQKSVTGSPDGLHTQLYEEGQIYDVPEALAEVYLREGWAVSVDSKKAKGPSANKERNKERGLAPA